ncbi:MAG: hypothetical protein GKR94_07195 [Gammaproteobacteria bacterium]|nr:hypothetical protein [Gammaproteobacteria bacterium]
MTQNISDIQINISATQDDVNINANDDVNVNDQINLNSNNTTGTKARIKMGIEDSDTRDAIDLDVYDKNNFKRAEIDLDAGVNPQASMSASDDKGTRIAYVQAGRWDGDGDDKQAHYHSKLGVKAFNGNDHVTVHLDNKMQNSGDPSIEPNLSLTVWDPNTTGTKSVSKTQIGLDNDEVYANVRSKVHLAARDKSLSWQQGTTAWMDIKNRSDRGPKETGEIWGQINDKGDVNLRKATFWMGTGSTSE